MTRRARREPHTNRDWRRSVTSGVTSGLLVVVLAAVVGGLSKSEFGHHLFHAKKSAGEPANHGPVHSSVNSSPGCNHGTQLPPATDIRGNLELSIGVRTPDSACWTPKTSELQPSGQLRVLISFGVGRAALDATAAARVVLPPDFRIVRGSVRLINGNYPNGYQYPDGFIERGGVRIGAYNPGTNGFITFTVVLGGPRSFDCGVNGNDIRATISGQEGNLASAHAEIGVSRLCSPTSTS